MIYRTLFLFIFLLSLSCSSKKLQRAVIADISQDSFSKESLWRRPAGELKANNSKHSLCLQGETSKALTLLKTEIDLRKNDYRYWEELGFCYYMDSDYQKALLYYDISSSKTNLSKAKSQINNNIALVYIKLGKIEKAKELFENSIKLNHNLSAIYNLALLYMGARQYKLASKSLKQLFKYNNRDPQIKYLLTITYLKNGELDNAYKLIKQINKRDYTPKIVIAIANILYLKNQATDADKLIKEHNLAIEKVIINDQLTIRAI